jgi:hypothetical protein
VTIEPRAPELVVEPVKADARAAIAARAQRRVWACFLGAFAIWCTLIVFGGVTANSWRKTAYSLPAAQLVSKRGIVLYQGPRDERPISVSEHADLEEGGIIEVPSSSEATLQLRVDKTQIRLRAGSQLRLSEMRVGRFNRDLTQVKLEQLAGAANYNVFGDLPDGREIEVRTPTTWQPQDTIKLTKGEYLVWVQQPTTRVVSYIGQAKAEVDGATLRLRDGKWVVFGPERPDLRQPLDLPEHLIKGRDFGPSFAEIWSPIDIGEKGRPDVGGQRAIVEDLVNGQTLRTLHLTRDTAKDTHNETGLSQEINREVWAYRKVGISAWVKVNDSSLDGGGYAGSEYPLMLRVKYVAENGGSYVWAHGFYFKNETNRPVDIGEQVLQGAWHRFTFDLSGLRERPAYIAGVEILASGHDFDAQVANVDLTVE